MIDKGETEIFRRQDVGHSLGTVTQEPRVSGGKGDSAAVQITVAPVMPRLLDLPTAAAYLGVSAWTIRDLEAAGTVPRVRIPLPNAGELRKLLFDRADLDHLIDGWKDAR